jgi:hypothetical protein
MSLLLVAKGWWSTEQIVVQQNTQVKQSLTKSVGNQGKP